MIVGTEEIPGDAMRRGRAVLLIPSAEDPRVFPFYVGGPNDRVGADLVVRAGTWIGFEPAVVVR
jgi:hypothetical protein